MPLKSKAKATHQGECQICDRVQKLLNTVLSQHGYKVESGFFNGVCPGSRHKPYELSCELIKDILPGVENYVKRLYEQKFIHSQPMLKPECFNYVWVKGSNGSRGIYTWKNGTLTTKQHTTSNGYQWKETFFNFDDCSVSVSNDNKLNLLDLATELNLSYVKRFITPLISQTEGEIRRLERKINDWKLQELKPV